MERSPYWFPAKRYGWGWGLPVTWQGWAVLVAYVALVAIGAFAFPPHANPAGFIAYIGLITGVLVLVCYMKGEPPKWRWGK